MTPEENHDRSGRRLAVLDALREATTPQSIKAVADGVGVHPNTARYHLEALVDSGQAERVDPTQHGTGRPPLLFRATPGMDPTGPRQYRLLAEVLVQSLATGPNQRTRAIAAGRSWGRASGAEAPEPADGTSVERLVALLDELGFAPEQRADGDEVQVGLHHCPFLELADTNPEVVCPVHLGLMQGAMEEWDADETVVQLDRLVEPDLCLAHLGPAPDHGSS